MVINLNCGYTVFHVKWGDCRVTDLSYCCTCIEHQFSCGGYGDYGANLSGNSLHMVSGASDCFCGRWSRHG